MPSHLDFSQGCTAIDDLTHCSACACGYMRPPSKGWFLGWLSGARGDRVPSGHISQSPSRPPIRRSRDTVRQGPTARWRDHGLPPVFEPERAGPNTAKSPSFSPRLKYTCEPTTHRSVRMVFLPTPHHRGLNVCGNRQRPRGFGCQLIVQQLVGVDPTVVSRGAIWTFEAVVASPKPCVAKVVSSAIWTHPLDSVGFPRRKTRTQNL